MPNHSIYDPNSNEKSKTLKGRLATGQLASSRFARLVLQKKRFLSGQVTEPVDTTTYIKLRPHLAMGTGNKNPFSCAQYL